MTVEPEVFADPTNRTSDEANRIKRAYLEGAEPSHRGMIRCGAGRRRYETVIQRLGAASGKRILDLGSGEGNLEVMLFKSGVRPALVLGMDLDRAKLMHAAEVTGTSTPVQYLWADAENLPFRRGSFDIVVATEVLEHVPDESRLVAELLRISPDRIVITVPSLRCYAFLAAVGSERIFKWAEKTSKTASSAGLRVRKIIKAMTIPLSPLFAFLGAARTHGRPYHDYWAYHGNVPHRLYTSAYLVDRLRQGGFTVESVEGAGFPLPLLADAGTLAAALGVDSLGALVERIQVAVERRFVRSVDRNQNLVVVCTSGRPLGTGLLMPHR